MNRRTIHLLSNVGITAMVLCFSLILSTKAISGLSPSQTTISGLVRDHNGPIANATVRVKTTNNKTTTDVNGRFIIQNLKPDAPVVLTAWAEGYYIGGGNTRYLPGASDVEIVLTPHSDEDNQNYHWLSAFTSAGYAGSREDSNCENCHADPNNPKAALPFSEWQEDAHALSARNIRFLTMYSGTDISGNQSPQTRYIRTRDYGRIPLRPDPNKPYFGPGYKLDFPDSAGNCAACHTPVAAIDTAYITDPTKVSGVETEGVACDFCHKIWGVCLDSKLGMPYPNMPGVLSFEFRRPPEGHQFFAGPFDDVAPGEDTYSPIQTKSQYCAPCHFGVFWNTLVYNSFGEWLESPYSNPETGKTCQDCHMPRGQTNYFARLDKGGLIRDPKTIFSHLMPGAMDEELLQNAVSVDVNANRQGEQIVVTVNVTNDQTGHHVPTDSPLRHLILIVRAIGEQRHFLRQIEGPTIPEYGGIGNSDQGYYAGLPGKIFAKVLEELWTEVSPTGAYWNPTRILSDNRLAAFATDTSTYTFSSGTDNEVTVEVKLLFRRAFIDLIAKKNWNTPDILMEHEQIKVSVR